MTNCARTALPATPRKRVPGARTLMTTGAGVRDAIAACTGRALTVFTLAQIAALQADADFREELPRLDNYSDSAPEKPWQTFENLVSDTPEKCTTAPVTVATDVKMACAALLVAVADLANSHGKLPADPLAVLGQAPWREANVVRMMAAATAKMRPLLRQEPLCRDLEFLAVFRLKFEAIVRSKPFVDPGADQIARLYVDFLKVIAWHAGVQAYEEEHLTLNLVTFYSILASLQGAVPEEDGPSVRDVLSFVRVQVEQWSSARALATAAKKKPAPRKAPARPAAKTAATLPAPATAKKGLPPADEAEPETEAEASPEAEPGPGPGPETEAEPEAAPGPETEAEPEAAPGPETEAEPEAAPGPDALATTVASVVAPGLNYDALILELDGI